MRILHTVKSYSPLSGGMYEVVRRISEGLSKRGHEVVIASGKGAALEGCDDAGMKVEVFDVTQAVERERYQSYVLTSDFDVITNFAAQQPMTDLLLPLLPKIRAKKVFVPTGFNALHSKTHRGYFQQMAEWMKGYDMNVFLSYTYQDIAFARMSGLPDEKIAVIPNGASKEEFMDTTTIGVKKALDIGSRTHLILHVGSFTGVKGHDEAIDIFTRAQTRDAVLLLVGNGETSCAQTIRQRAHALNESPKYQESKKRIITTSLTRGETVSAYKEADVFLFPSNTECSPIVLFEAMAAGLPFLSSEVGNAKEIIAWSGGGLLLPTRQNVLLGRGWKEKAKKALKRFLIRLGLNLWNPDLAYAQAEIGGSAKMLEELLRDPDRRRALGRAGREAWLRRFTWELITDQYERLYSALLAV